MKRPSYRKAVEWIAWNDEPTLMTQDDLDVVAGQVSTVLVADLFGVEMARVARDVIVLRRRLAAEPEFDDYSVVRPDGPETARGGLIGQQPY